MEQLSATDSITLEAFQAALDTCIERGIELPEAIQAVAKDLRRHIEELDELSERDATFELLYQTGRIAIQNASATRGKRLSSAEAASSVATIGPTSVKEAVASYGGITLGTAHSEQGIAVPEAMTNEATTSAQTVETKSPVQDTQPPSESKKTLLQRFVLPNDATEGDRQYFQTYIEELEQLNPGWKLIRDRCRTDESEAYIMIRDDEEYQVNYATYLTSQIINEFFSELSL